ncbi:hypothetical protein GQ600_16014 [Phytophthora cactorum]|nr:hypothetical protein GQ600_16014 [Phytophthora cactorum]
MTTIAARGDERADDAADFLRRLSVADAKVLLEGRGAKEKENKTKEMQKMIGVRYRDLIESADKIVNMHSAALHLEVSLKEMPDMWKHMELSLAGALAEERRSEETTDADEVAFLVETEEIFGNGSESGLLKSISQLPPSFKDGLEQFISSGKMLKMLSDWFERKRRQILEIASPIISSIDSISQLSQVQSKLYVVNKNSGGCQNVQLWGHVLQEARGSLEKQLNGPHSFVEALEAIKTQIRASVEDTVASISRSDYRLRNVKFYDYFETIQKKAADLDASDLQSVLIEEFLRTLFKLVIFFEKEYPVIQKPNAPSGAIQLPSVFLSISNILAGIVAGFHRQTNKLFPGSSTTVEIPEKDPSLSTVGPVFEKYSNSGFVMKAKLTAALEEILGDGENTLACFIDEELGRVNAVGLYSLFLVSEIKQKASYPQLFVNVLHGLSKKYCEAWATILLEQKIDPLRELMLIEQYDSPTSLDDANRLVQSSIGTKDEQIKLMQRTIREVLVEQLTICCIQQFLFDMYFVRATLGFSDFIRFGWGDELNPEDCSPGLLKLKSLFERMREFIDPVDWEIYGPQLIENVVLQFRKSRLLFSSLSESNDINKISKSSLVLM